MSKKNNKSKKSYNLIIDGNLLARKSFYKFKNLSVKVPLKDLSFLSKSLRSSIKEEEKKEEFISENSGNKISISEGKIEEKIKNIVDNRLIEVKTGVLYGMLRSILTVIKSYNIKKIVIVYDPVYRKNNLPFRKDLYPEYKNRKKDSKTEEEFFLSLSLALSFFYKIGIEQAKTEIFEADDLLDYYIKKVFKNEYSLILTEDHDLFQLISKRVSILRIGKFSSLFDLKSFKEKYNISPKTWREVLALGGCSTDNISGIRGISSSSAISLLRKYRSLKNLLKSYRSDSSLEKRFKTILDRERKNKFKSLKLSLRLVSLYGSSENLKSDLSIIKSTKSKESREESLFLFLKILKFNSFLIDPNLSLLKEILNK